MKRRTKLILAAGAAAGGWGIHRRRKYPIARGFPPLELFPIPGGVLTAALAEVGNAALSRVALPAVCPGVSRATLTVPGGDGQPLPITLYRPEGERGPLPCLIYFHGGGFCFQDAGYLHRNVMDYARLARCAVAFVHYRTADRAPFPAPFRDCCQALGEVFRRAGELGLDGGRLAVGGDSAGGALAAACAHWARGEGKVPLRFQLLIYPVTDARMATRSMKQYTDSPLWNTRLNRKMWRLYLRDGLGDTPRHYASPMEAAGFAGLPPAYVEVEEFDCLHDEGAAYARALRAAGCPVEFHDLARSFHGFDLFRKAPLTRAALRTRARALFRAFHTAG